MRSAQPGRLTRTRCGVLAASATGYTDDYVALPMSDAGRAALKPGANVIAVHCHQTTGGQGVDVGIVEAK